MEILLVRHGEPDWEPGGIAVDDPELTPRGHAMAARVAEALADQHFDVAYVSPLRRARETMAPIAERLGLTPRVSSGLEELRLPRMEGRTTAEVQRFFREARERDLEHWWDGFPGGETFRHFYERVSADIEALLHEEHDARVHEDGGHRLWHLPDEKRRLLIVAHEGTNAVIVSHLLGIDPVPWAWLRFSMAWCGFSTVRTVPVASGRVWRVEGFNETEHLRDLGGDHDGSFQG